VNEPGYYNCTVSTAEATQIDLTVLYYVLPIAVVIIGVLMVVIVILLIINRKRKTKQFEPEQKPVHYQNETANI
jgi:TRAP-type C4-dicarboxylate transport system permease small subunit